MENRPEKQAFLLTVINERFSKKNKNHGGWEENQISLLLFLKTVVY